jgi:hypothetical protein
MAGGRCCFTARDSKCREGTCGVQRQAASLLLGERFTKRLEGRSLKVLCDRVREELQAARRAEVHLDRALKHLGWATVHLDMVLSKLREAGALKESTP